MLPLSGSSSGTSFLPASELERALQEAARLLRFRLKERASPTRAEALRLVCSVLEVLAGRAPRVELLAPCRVWQPRDESERRTYRATLERCSWNKAKAARELGLSRATFVDRLKALGVRVPDGKNRVDYTRGELLDAIRSANGNKAAAARALALSRDSLERQLRKAGLPVRCFEF